MVHTFYLLVDDITEKNENACLFQESVMHLFILKDYLTLAL